MAAISNINVKAYDDNLYVNNLHVNNENADDKANDKERKTIQANSLNLGTDIVENKREEARKKAMKVLGDTFSKDVAKDTEFDMRSKAIDELKNKIAEAKMSVKDVDEKLNNLQEEYGVQDGSKEQEDLILLKKEIDSNQDNLNVRLTDEEKAKLADIKAGGITEYQERALQLYERGSVNSSNLVDYERELEYQIKSLQAAKIDRLKSAPMVEASEEAEDILKEANEQIIGMLIDEVKENIDEKAEEAAEKAEKAKEEQEKLEELLDNKDDTARKDITDEIPLDKFDDITNIQAEIRKIVKDTGLSQEDMLGLTLDEDV